MIKNNFELYIVATPIGNLEDISERAIKTIKESDTIICENPNHSLKLLNKLGIKKKLISLHDYNESTVIKKIANKLPNQKTVLISDAGSPLVSDPGFKLIQHCIKNNLAITSIPGPSSIIPSLQLSGIPINQFYFMGFFPKTKRQMLEFTKIIEANLQTCVFFVSSHKINFCLEIIDKLINDRQISVSKELTKLNEKTYRGSAKEVIVEINKQKENLKGEFVVVVEGKSQKETVSSQLTPFNNEINKLLSKFSLTDVVEIVHKLTGIKKNKVYKWVLNIKNSYN